MEIRKGMQFLCIKQLCNNTVLFINGQEYKCTDDYCLRDENNRVVGGFNTDMFEAHFIETEPKKTRINPVTLILLLILIAVFSWVGKELKTMNDNDCSCQTYKGR